MGGMPPNPLAKRMASRMSLRDMQIPKSEKNSCPPPKSWGRPCNPKVD